MSHALRLLRYIASSINSRHDWKRLMSQECFIAIFMYRMIDVPFLSFSFLSFLLFLPIFVGRGKCDGPALILRGSLWIEAGNQ